MASFIIRRLVRGLITLVLFQSLLFGLIYALPFDFSTFGGGPGGRAFLQELLNLDRPFGEQLISWLGDFFRLNLGQSFLYWPTPVLQLIVERAPRTLILFLSAAVLAYAFGVWMGKMIAWKRGGVVEALATLGGVAAYTSFAPFLAFAAVNVFGYYLGWFPYRRLVDQRLWYQAPVTVDALLGLMLVTILALAGLSWGLWRATRQASSRLRRWQWRAGGLLLMAGVAGGWWAQSGFTRLAMDLLWHLTLPLGTVITLSFGETMMIMRTTMLETLGEDYVTMARAKGLPDNLVRDRHVARNALLPVLTRLLLNLPFVLVGSLVIEQVFFWQAMGVTLFAAIEFVDLPLLLGVLSVVAVITVIAHVVLDILYVYLDPRLRYARAD